METNKIQRFTLFGILCALLLHAPLMAQEERTQSNTLFDSGTLISKEHIGFFVAPGYAFTQMDGSAASMFHVRGGFSYKDKLAAGAFYNVSINEITPESELLNNIYMDHWSIGGFVEYTAFSKKMVHLSFPLYVGVGEVQMDNQSGDARLGESGFFQVEPSALLEINLHKFVRFNVGAGYRIVGDMRYRNFDQSDISGLTGYVGLKIGLFD